MNYACLLRSIVPWAWQRISESTLSAEPALSCPGKPRILRRSRANLTSTQRRLRAASKPNLDRSRRRSGRGGWRLRLDHLDPSRDSLVDEGERSSGECRVAGRSQANRLEVQENKGEEVQDSTAGRRGLPEGGAVVLVWLVEYRNPVCTLDPSVAIPRERSVASLRRRCPASPLALEAVTSRRPSSARPEEAVASPISHDTGSPASTTGAFPRGEQRRRSEQGRERNEAATLLLLPSRRIRQVFPVRTIQREEHDDDVGDPGHSPSSSRRQEQGPHAHWRQDLFAVSGSSPLCGRMTTAPLPDSRYTLYSTPLHRATPPASPSPSSSSSNARTSPSSPFPPSPKALSRFVQLLTGSSGADEMNSRQDKHRRERSRTLPSRKESSAYVQEGGDGKGGRGWSKVGSSSTSKTSVRTSGLGSEGGGIGAFFSPGTEMELTLSCGHDRRIPCPFTLFDPHVHSSFDPLCQDAPRPVVLPHSNVFDRLKLVLRVPQGPTDVRGHQRERERERTASDARSSLHLPGQEGQWRRGGPRDRSLWTKQLRRKPVRSLLLFAATERT